MLEMGRKLWLCVADALYVTFERLGWVNMVDFAFPESISRCLFLHSLNLQSARASSSSIHVQQRNETWFFSVYSASVSVFSIQDKDFVLNRTLAYTQVSTHEERLSYGHLIFVASLLFATGIHIDHGSILDSLAISSIWDNQITLKGQLLDSSLMLLDLCQGLCANPDLERHI